MLAEEILVVNDGSPLLQMIAGLLQNKGYQVSLTDSSEEALVLLSTRNIVLTVLKMDGPQPDRLGMLHLVKELHSEARLVIVGEATSLPAEIFEIETDDYILLPCRIADVWRRLTRLLESPVSASESSAVSREQEVLMHPANQRVLHNLGLLFHDMRGLLTAISEGMRLLEGRIDGGIGEDAESIFQQTYRKTQTLLNLSNEFFQKFRQCTVPDQVDLMEEVIEPVVQEFSEDLQKSRISLNNRLLRLPPAQRVIRADRAALKSVFRNLMNNAMTNGGCGCTITIDLDEAPGHFRLQVQNSGEPISGSRQKLLFSGMKQARSRGQGMGLGLHLGRQVMRSMGGDVSYEPGCQGSNFIMTVPRG